MQIIETPEMKALRVAMEDTVYSLHQRVLSLSEQTDALQAQNRLLSGEVADLMEMVGRLEAALMAQEAA